MPGDLNERLKVECGDGEIRLTLMLCPETIVDGERRMLLVARALRQWARKLRGIEIETTSRSMCFRFFPSDQKTFDVSADRLRRRINQILSAPVTPEVVDRTLGITARERLRWYKDGRLPTCGRAVIGRGNHQVGFPLFPVDAIARLAETPDIIESWRADDERELNSPETRDCNSLA